MSRDDSSQLSTASENPSVATDKLTLERDNLTWVNEKLSIEINELKNESAFLKRANRMVPIMTSLLGLAGLWFGVVQYWGAENKASLQRQNELLRETAKPLWDKRLELYVEATNVAATIATATKMDSKECLEAEARFWVLYYGPMSAVEDTGLVEKKRKEEGDDAKTVERAMIEFGKELGKNAKDRDTDVLKELSLDLAHVVREEIDPTRYDKTYFADVTQGE